MDIGQTKWVTPAKYFRNEPNILFEKETDPEGKIFLLAIDNDGKIVAGMKLKKLNQKSIKR